MADKISEIYGKAVQKGVLAEGMTEDQFREKTSTEKGLRSFYNYASTHGMKFHDYDTFKQRFYGTQNDSTNTQEQQEQNANSAIQEDPKQQGESINEENSQSLWGTIKNSAISAGSKVLQQLNALGDLVGPVANPYTIAADPNYAAHVMRQHTHSRDEKQEAANRVQEAEKSGKQASEEDKALSAGVRYTQKLNEEQQKYAKEARKNVGENATFTGLIKQGDVKGALELGMITAIESAPQMIMGMNVPGRIMLGTLTAADEYDRLSRERPEMSVTSRAIQSVSAGIIEQFWESQWNPLKVEGKVSREFVSKMLKDWSKKGGKETLKDLNKVFVSWAKDTFGEGLEEVMTSVSNDIVQTLVGTTESMIKNDLVGDGMLRDLVEASIADGNPNDFTAKDIKQFVRNVAVGYLNDFLGGAMAGGYMGSVSHGMQAAGTVKEHISERNEWNNLSETEKQALRDKAEAARIVIEREANVGGNTRKKVIEYLDHYYNKGQNRDNNDYIRYFEDEVKNEIERLQSERSSQQSTQDESVIDQPKAEETQTEEAAQELLSTGNKPLEFTLRMKMESRESGKTSDVEKDVKVSFRSGGYRYTDDGSIVADKFTILIGGKPATGKMKERAMAAINDKLRADKIVADNQVAAEAQAQADQAAAQVQAEQEAVAEQAAVQAEEQRVQEVYAGLQQQVGEKGLEVIKRFTPEQKFIWTMQEEGVEAALEDARIYLDEASQEKDPTIRRTGMRQWQTLIDKYGTGREQVEPIQQKQEPAQQVEQKEERIRQENRRKAGINLDNSENNSNIAQNSENNDNTGVQPTSEIGTSTPLPESTEGGLGEDQGNSGADNGAVDSSNADEVRSEITAVDSLDNPSELEEEQEEAQGEVQQQEPVDLTAPDVVLMTSGAGTTRQTFVFAKKVTDESGNVTYISLGNPYNKSVPAFGKALRSNWGELDKSKKMFYVKDIDGNPIACYAFTKEDLSTKKFKPGAQLNAVVASSGEMITAATSMPAAYVIGKNGEEVSILKGETNQDKRIRVESVKALLDYPIVIRYKSEAKGQDEIVFTLRDLLYSGKYKGDSHIISKDDEKKTVKRAHSHPYSVALEYLREESRKAFGADVAGAYTSEFNTQLRHLFEAWNAYCKEIGLTDISDKLNKLTQSDRDLFWSARAFIGGSNRDEADKASLTVSTDVDAKQMSEYLRANPLHQLAVMLYIGSKVAPQYVSGAEFAMLPGKSGEAGKGRVKNVQPMVTKDVIEKVRERYKALKAGKVSFNADSYVSDADEITNLERFYPEVLTDEPVHNRPRITEDNEKKVKQEIQNNKLQEEAAKKAAKEATKTDEEREADQYDILEKTIEDGFAKLEAALAEKNDEKVQEYTAQLNMLITGNEAAQQRLQDMLAEAMAQEVEHPVPVEPAAPVVEEQPAAQEPEVATEEPAAEPAAQAAEEVPTPEKRRKRNKKETPADQLRTMMENVRDLKKRMALGDREVTPSSIQEATDAIMDFISENGDTEELWNMYNAEFSVSPEQIATTERSRTIGNILLNMIGRIKGPKVHLLNSHDDVMRTLAGLLGMPEFMSAYHGTDAKFDKFDLSFVGNGEGAQAYGFGVYVSRNKGVSTGYAKRITRSKMGDSAATQLYHPEKGNFDVNELYTWGYDIGGVGHDIIDEILFEANMQNLKFGDAAYFTLTNNLQSKEAQEKDISRMETALDFIKFIESRGDLSDADALKLMDYEDRFASWAESLDDDDVRIAGIRHDLKAYTNHLYADINRTKEALKIGLESMDEDIAELDKAVSLIQHSWLKNIEVKPMAGFLYTVDIPDDTGENYLAWNKRLTDEQLDKIYKAFPQFKYQVDGTPTGETVYDALQAYIQRAKRRAQILFDGIPDNLLKGGKLYEELREYAKRKLPGVPEDVDEAVDNLIDGLYNGLSRGSLENSIETRIMQDMSTGGLQRIFGEWLDENKDRFSTNLSDGFESNRLDEAASKALYHIGFKGIKVPINYLHSGGRNARSDEDYNYILFNDSDVKILNRESIEYLKTPEGTIYGFAIGDEIYITQEGLNADTPIHEFTHLWVKTLRANDRKLWKKIVKELKQNKALWEAVTKDDNYKHLTSDDAIASEVLARFCGKKGAELLEQLAKGQKFGSERLEKAFINRAKRSVRTFWQWVAEKLFGWAGYKAKYSEDTIDDFADMVLRDLFDGKALLTETERNAKEDERIKKEMADIKDKAIKDGTFLTYKGRRSNLPERLWLLVRTENFKDWFGDWENDPLNASKVVDENGEPLVVYHGTNAAGFDRFRLDKDADARSGSQGFYNTDNRRVAAGYTREAWNELPKDAQEAILGADPHEAIYSLFANIRNPWRINFADEDGNKRHWNEYPSGKWAVMGNEELGIEEGLFDSEEEANDYLAQFGGNEKPFQVMLSTDDFLRRASAAGFDGCIFTGVYDGNFTIGEDMTDYVALLPTQLKSVHNRGYFSTIDDRIEYQYTESELSTLDEQSEKRIRREEDNAKSTMINPDLSEQERANWWENVVTMIADKSNGMRLILNSINAYRRLRGEEPLDGDKYDVRTKFEACRSIIANKVGFLERGIQKELDDTVREFAQVVADSQFYKDHMNEVGGDKPTTLTPVQFIERYLMARNNWERAKEGVPRGLAEFKERMGMGVIEFSDAFTEAYGEKTVLDLWEKIRQMTDFALDTNYEGGMISEELYQELKSKKFYVPQRGFWDDVNPENEENAADELLQRRQRGNSVARNKLDSMHKAEGGKSLAEGCLAYIARDARQAIKLSEENKVKKVMFDLLRDNEDWCHEPEHSFKVPRQVYYMTNENGEIVRIDDGPTEEQKQEMHQLKGIIRQLKEEYMKAETDEERDAIMDEIYATEEQLPYFDEKDSYRILHTRAKTNKAIVGLYVNGYPCEIEMTPRFISVADALNGRVNRKGEIAGLKTVTSWLSAQFTMNNPTFFAVNITRDTPLILTKGAAEYGPEFSARFTVNWAKSQKAIWNYLLTGKVDDSEIGAQLLDFLNYGGNTGYSNLEEMDRWRRRVADMNPGGLQEIRQKLSSIEGAKDAAKMIGKGLLKFGDKTISWAELRPMAQVLNEWSEIISRFSAYKSVVDMGLGVNEGIKAAHNLSTNFNRRGLGHWFINFFNSLTVFANAGIQGASGYWRTFDSQDGVKGIAKKVAKTAAYMGMLPAFLGFLSTMLNPDDDDYEYAVSEYERDNYVILGDKRLALNEQLKPWWVIGVNIAQLARGKRTLKQSCNSILTSMFTNWVPLPQNLTGSANMLIENITGKEEWNIAQIARNSIMPSAMQTMNQWADNKNFLGGKLRYDIGDIPEYDMAPNEAALYQDLAKVFYLWDGGNEKVPSKTKENGEKIRRWWDVNPKEIKSNMFWIPSGALDNFCLAYGIYKDVREKMDGDFTETNVRVKDLPVINRFYKPSDNTLYRYSVVREAREMVKVHNDRINNLKKQAAHFSDVYSQTRDPKADEAYAEALRLLSEEMSDVTLVEMDKILSVYNKSSIRSLQQELGEAYKDLKRYHPDAVKELDAAEKDLVQLMLEGVNQKRGLRRSDDIPEWIEWFDNHSPSRKRRREE